MPDERTAEMLDAVVSLIEEARRAAGDRIQDVAIHDLVVGEVETFLYANLLHNFARALETATADDVGEDQTILDKVVSRARDISTGSAIFGGKLAVRRDEYESARDFVRESSPPAYEWLRQLEEYLQISACEVQIEALRRAND